MTNTIIDAVITWVDGQDKTHIEKRAQFINANETTSLHSEATHVTRFNQAGELKYCVLSILKFMPWIRNIFIVTDNQIPAEVLSLHPDKIKLIFHETLFKPHLEVLPTFNSLTIEAMLWNIDALSEHFIYFNDDIFVTQECAISDFFIKDQPVISALMKKQKSARRNNPLLYLMKIFGIKNKPIAPHRQLQEKCAQKLGMNNQYLHLPHHPFPLLKSKLKAIFDNSSDFGTKNIQYRFRSNAQYWNLSIFYHQAWLNQSLILKKRPEITLNPCSHGLKKIKRRIHAILANQSPFLCIQNMCEANHEVLHYLKNWLKDYYGEGR